MSTRREFVEGAAGIAFVACSMTGIAPVQAQGRRREVVVNGRRVKTIDVHAHCAVPEALALMGRKVEPQTLLMSNAADRIRAMDEQGIDMEALRSEEHTSELQSPCNLVCRLLLEKKKKIISPFILSKKKKKKKTKK